MFETEGDSKSSLPKIDTEKLNPNSPLLNILESFLKNYKNYIEKIRFDNSVLSNISRYKI